MSAILAFLTAVAVFSFYLLIDHYITEQKRRKALRERLMPDGSILSGHYDDAAVHTRTPSAFAARLLNLMRRLGIRVEESSRRLERRLAQAGISSPDATAYYLFAQRIGGILLLMLAMLIAAGAPPESPLSHYITALVLALVGLFGPKLYLQNRIDKWKQKLKRAFPDTLDLLLICVESGLALDASLARVCAELGRAYPEMTAELNRTRLELALINDRVRALMNLGERTDMPAFRSLIASLIQSERFGTSLSDTLRVLSDEFRIQRLADAEVKAARLPVLMTIPLIFLLMPALLMVVLGPAIVRISHSLP